MKQLLSQYSHLIQTRSDCNWATFCPIQPVQLKAKTVSVDILNHRQICPLPSQFPNSILFPLSLSIDLSQPNPSRNSTSPMFRTARYRSDAERLWLPLYKATPTRKLTFRILMKSERNQILGSERSSGDRMLPILSDIRNDVPATKSPQPYVSLSETKTHTHTSERGPIGLT